VGHARENWNYIFEDLQTFCERLEELDLEMIIEIDQKDFTLSH